jgi:hypothetical protein
MNLASPCLLLCALFGTTLGFSSTLFQAPPDAQIFRSKQKDAQIELPDFDVLFDEIKQVSPLSRIAITGGDIDGARGFDAIDDSMNGNLKWKTVESSKRQLVHHIDKIDNFRGKPAPILRFRANLEGLCDGEFFANFIMNLEDRQLWDPQIDDVYEAYTIDDLEAANIAMGFKYGDCIRLGAAYSRTKKTMGIDAREQLTVCGYNAFPDGSCMIWGKEMAEKHNHLLPQGKRHARAKSHIFSVTLVPTGHDSFDVEYVLQLEIGGNIPTWLTTPAIVDNVKNLFSCVQPYYLGKDGKFMSFAHRKLSYRCVPTGYSLLMTP